MRRYALVLFLLVASCGDTGFRDRSLSAKLQVEARQRSVGDRILSNKRNPTKGKASLSVVGLVPDPLATYYPEGAHTVVRFDALVVLQREAATALSKIREIAPDLGLPDLSPGHALKSLLGISSDVRISATKPFALVFSESSWVAILPCTDAKAGGARMRAVDALYAVAGEPDAIAAYRASYRKGFFLPGDCSVITTPEGLQSIGTTFTRALEKLRIDLTPLNRLVPKLPIHVERVDLTARFAVAGVRIDMRAGSRGNSEMAQLLRHPELRPTNSAALSALPPKGTLYVETGTDAALLAQIMEGILDPQAKYAERTEKQAAFRRAWQRALTVLGQNAGIVLDLEPDGSGVAMLVSHAPNRSVDGFFGSDEMQTLLDAAAGEPGALQFKRAVFERAGCKVSSIRGSINHERNLAWRRSGGPFLATLSMLLRGPVLMHVARVDNKICVVVGKRSRAAMEALIDQLQSGNASTTAKDLDVSALFPQRLVSCTVDLAALFDGLRDAAPYWHEDGARLQNHRLRWSIPAAFAATVEGDAMRFTLRLAPKSIADAWMRLRAALATESD